MIAPYGREAQFLSKRARRSKRSTRRSRFRAGHGALAMGDLAGSTWLRIRKVQAPRKTGRARAAGVRFSSAKMDVSGRRPARAGTSTTKIAGHSRSRGRGAIEKTARAAGVERRNISAEEIVDRCIYALVNEARGYLKRASRFAPWISISFISTVTDFPRGAGGDVTRIASDSSSVLARVEAFEQRHGVICGRRAPAERLAEAGKTSPNYDRKGIRCGGVNTPITASLQY